MINLPVCATIAECVCVVSLTAQVYMVMEYMEHDLRSYLDNLREPLSLSEIKCIVQQLLSALAYMHENWVIHRDLKTPNILINNDGRACLCDFGLARYRGSIFVIALINVLMSVRVYGGV